MSTDRRELFGTAVCARAVDGCLSHWTSYCKVCNNVFCGSHIHNHPCKPEDPVARKKLYEDAKCPPPK